VSVRPSFAFFLPSLDAGGAERVVLMLAERFVARGRTCAIVVAKSGGVWESRVPNGVRLVSLGGGKPVSFVRPLITWLKRERPAVLMSSIFPANIAALLACAATGTPCVIREANRTADDIRSNRHRTTFLNYIAMRLLYRRASAVIALSEGLASHVREIARIDAAHIRVIPNPAPASQPHALAKRVVPVVLGCGRLVPQKDFGTLLNAFAQVLRARPAQLVLLGEGPLRETLQGLAQSLGITQNVEFVGHSTAVAKWMTEADVFVLSSRWEGFPNVLLEALAAGCPVVATDCSDVVHALLGERGLGTIVPVADEAAMAGAINDVLDGKKQPLAATDWLAEYEPDLIATRYLDVLDHAAKGGR
jgi:glycosyltransferase involved in cell wall biosynthesis